MHTLLREANHIWTHWWRCGWLQCMHAPTSAQTLIRTRGYAHLQSCAPTLMRTRGRARMHARIKALQCTCAHSPPCTGVSASIRTRVCADMHTLMCTGVHAHTCKTSSNEGEAHKGREAPSHAIIPLSRFQTTLETRPQLGLLLKSACTQKKKRTLVMHRQETMQPGKPQVESPTH